MVMYFVIFSNRDKYMGGFLNDMAHGHGTYYASEIWQEIDGCVVMQLNYAQ